MKRLRPARLPPTGAASCRPPPPRRSPTELVWPANKHQQRCEYTTPTLFTVIYQIAYWLLTWPRTPPLLPLVASRVHAALLRALMGNAELTDRLIKELGLSISSVRMSPDCLKAFILWESCTGQARLLQHELQHRWAAVHAARKDWRLAHQGGGSGSTAAPALL